MILLEDTNYSIRETLRRWLELEKPAPIEAKIVDFDAVHYLLTCDNPTSELTVSMSIKCFPQLAKYGAKEIIRREYGDWYREGKEERGYDVTLKIPNPSACKEELFHKLGMLKRHVMSAPFYRAFATQSEGSSTDLMEIPYRGGESGSEGLYIQAQSDRVTVMFSTVFHEEADRIYAKVFLQEFADARRQPSLQNAPQVLYTNREPPLELRGIVKGVQNEDPDSMGYVTFVLFPRHYKEGPVREQTISQIQLFRNYLHYHIKCSKAYLHSRMRARVESSLKVLNRAKIDRETGEKKTISGRTFQRRT